MRLAWLFLPLVSCALVSGAPPNATFTDLQLYNGAWKVARKGTAKPDILINRCSVLGGFYACSQNVNGSSVALVVFVPAAQAGHFHVQNIMGDGRATGISELQISGDLWTYSNRQDEGGKTTYYRTVNKFTGKNRIHFESSHSDNNQDWSVDASGDEERSVSK